MCACLQRVVVAAIAHVAEPLQAANPSTAGKHMHMPALDLYDLYALRKPGVQWCPRSSSPPPPLHASPAAPAQLPQLITQETLRSLEVRPTCGGGKLKLGALPLAAGI